MFRTFRISLFKAQHALLASLVPAAFGAALFFTAPLAHAEDYDLVIRNGRVLDGTGAPAIAADIAVKAGRIVAIGKVQEHGRTEIDAHGLIVAPGFVDVHTHTEDVTIKPLAENFLRMGVTTIIAGNCGSSVTNMGKFFAQIEKKNASINVASLVGHGTVRREAMKGSFKRPPTEKELAAMKKMVDQAMQDGAVGLSTGLIYVPGTFAKTEEIIEVAKVAAAHGGIYATHMRNEGTEIMASLEEAFRIGREAKIPVEVSHLKLSRKTMWGKNAQVLEAIDHACANGVDVTQDQYAYTASSTALHTLLPDELVAGGSKKIQTLLNDPKEKAKLVASLQNNLKKGGFTNYSYVALAKCALDKSLNGLNIVEAARKYLGKDSVEDQIEFILIACSQGSPSAIFHGMCEDDVQAFMRHKNTMTASDGGIRILNADMPHPRSYGNNARVLGRYVRELKVLTLEDAIRKMTSLPATRFKLADRGQIKPGYWADIVVLDPDKVEDHSTFSDPHHYSTGISHVLVNGVPVIADNKHTQAKPGQAVRRGK